MLRIVQDQDDSDALDEGGAFDEGDDSYEGDESHQGDPLDVDEQSSQEEQNEEQEEAVIDWPQLIATVTRGFIDLRENAVAQASGELSQTHQQLAQLQEQLHIVQSAFADATRALVVARRENEALVAQAEQNSIVASGLRRQLEAAQIQLAELRQPSQCSLATSRTYTPRQQTPTIAVAEDVSPEYLRGVPSTRTTF